MYEASSLILRISAICSYSASMHFARFLKQTEILYLNKFAFEEYTQYVPFEVGTIFLNIIFVYLYLQRAPKRSLHFHLYIEAPAKVEL
jgi:hypothetical protein